MRNVQEMNIDKYRTKQSQDDARPLAHESHNKQEGSSVP